MLYIDSLREYETEGNFNHYDSYHIDKIKSTIDMDILIKTVNKRLNELKAQRNMDGDKWKGIPENIRRECETLENREQFAKRCENVNPLIKVRAR